MTQKSMTSEKLMAKLSNDSEYQQKIQEKEAEFRKEEALLAKELQESV